MGVGEETRQQAGIEVGMGGWKQQGVSCKMDGEGTRTGGWGEEVSEGDSQATGVRGTG